MDDVAKWRAAQADAWLSEVLRRQKRAQRLKLAAMEAKDAMDGVRALSVGAGSRSRSAGDGVMADLIARAGKAGDAYARAAADSASVYDEATRALDAMDEQVGALALALHYLSLKPWREVAREVGYSYDGIMCLRRRALAELCEHMPKEVRDDVPAAL